MRVWTNWVEWQKRRRLAHSSIILGWWHLLTFLTICPGPRLRLQAQDCPLSAPQLMHCIPYTHIFSLSLSLSLPLQWQYQILIKRSSKETHTTTLCHTDLKVKISFHSMHSCAAPSFNKAPSTSPLPNHYFKRNQPFLFRSLF